VRAILLFFTPPVVGAVIGFITNVVAIKMLFRPLREIRVFGIRLPFTPGILPRQRSKLAQSIGAMVERELLTAEIVRQRLQREDVRQKIKEALSLFTENILQKTPGEIFDGREKLLADRLPSAAEKLYPAFAQAVLDFLGQEDIRRELESRGRIFLRNILFKLNAFQRLFFSAGQYDQKLEEKMPEIIDELVMGAENLLHNERTKSKLIEAVCSSAGKAIGGQGANIGSLLDIDEANKKALDNFLFEKLMTAADGQIENILTSINIKALVSDRIDSLDMLRVERIILDVMADQFKWIDIFGGILGFLIGLFQSTLNIFLR
jgi:uncharacterized membrane protein YheB (UPF0754 family)